MHTTTSASAVLTDFLDVIDAALATVARRLPTHISRDDLASVGKIALISSLEQFQGAPADVRAYAFVRVRGAMLDELRRLDPLSRSQRDKVTAVARAQIELGTRLGRAATRAEVSLATKLSLSEIVAAEAVLAGPEDSQAEELEAFHDPDAPSPADSVEREDLRFALRGALARLSSTQAAVLYRYYFDEATLETISVELGVSKERVRQIREAGEKKLRADFVVLSVWQTLIDRLET